VTLRQAELGAFAGGVVAGIMIMLAFTAGNLWSGVVVSILIVFSLAVAWAEGYWGRS